MSTKIQKKNKKNKKRGRVCKIYRGQLYKLRVEKQKGSLCFCDKLVRDNQLYIDIPSELGGCRYR